MQTGGLRIIPEVIAAVNNCSRFHSCSSCVDASGCSWCGGTSTCLSSSDSSCDDASNSCSSPEYIVIIFVVILVVLVCLCFGTCYWRKFRNFEEDIIAPLLPQQARNFLWRNSLQDQGESEWMCVICGFDNKPRAKHCIMCGTSYKFTMDYKCEKSEMKKKALEAKTSKKKQHKSIFGSRSGLVTNKMHDHNEGTPIDSVVINRENDLKITPDLPLLSSTSSHSNAGAETPVRESSSTNNNQHRGSSFGVSFNTPLKADLERSLIASPELTAILMESAASTSRSSLSGVKRREALNYRRLNQLSLRQKSARRRKMWQRQYDPMLGTMVWVRASVKETMIGSAPFGYSPSASFSEHQAGAGSSSSFAAGGGIGSGGGLAGISQSIPFRSQRGDSDDSSNGNPTSNSPVKHLIEAARAGGPSGNRARTLTSEKTSASDSSSKEYSDSFGDPVLLSSSPGYTSKFDEDGTLTWEKVESRRAVRPSHVKATTKPLPRQPSSSTFSNVSATSAGAGAGPPRRGESNANISVNNRNGPQSQRPTSGGAIGGTDEKTEEPYPIHMEDLEAIAAMTFREKQLWFLTLISRMQKPWSEGCVVMDLHREFVVEESMKALLSIQNTNDLHKWLRIQFVGEPGIDAGGLEREWFDLIARGLMHPSRGLFVNGLSESLGGSYHINPLSGQLNPDHLSYFRFAGRVFGKAIMEQQPIPATLSLPIRKQMLGLPITFSDLEFVDADLHRNLLFLQSTTGVEALSLDFTVTYEAPLTVGPPPTTSSSSSSSNASASGKGGVAPPKTTTTTTLKQVYELIPNGENTIVTDENKEQYLILRLRHRMLDSVRPQLEQLLKGLYEVLPPDLLSVFDYQELELLLCGIPDIDVADWMRHTEYLAEYHHHGARHKVIRWFWLAVEAMSAEERIRLLQFTTGCSRVPAQGFKALQSHDGHYRKFNIQSIKKSESLYPRAHTCFNKLDLPVYDSQEELDAYLSVVINMEITGFSME